MKSAGTPRMAFVCWVDRLFNPFARFGVWKVAAGYGVIGLLVAATPLAMAGQWRYIFDRPLFLGGFGVAWVMAAVRSITLEYWTSLEALRSVLTDDAKIEYDVLLQGHRRDMADLRTCFRPTLVLWLGVVLASIPIWYHWIDTQGFRWLYILPPDWYLSQGVEWRMVSMWLMAIPVITLVWGTGRLLMVYVRFVAKIATLDFMHSPSIFVVRMRPVLRHGIVSALTWSVGVGLFVILFGHLDAVQLSLLSCLAGVGAAGFVIPLIALREKLLEMQLQRHELLLDMMLRTSRKKIMKEPERLMRLMTLEEKIDAKKDVGLLLFELRYIASAFATFVIPIFINIISEHLK